MRFRRRLRLLRSLGRDQSGLAVPTALMALLATFGLASVAVLSTVNVQQSTKRDHSSKEAIAAADAGANIAMLRLNRFAKELASYQCVGANGEAQVPSGGWCPRSPIETAGGATYYYEVSAYSGTAGVQVVSRGTSGSVARRVDVSLLLQPPEGVFKNENLIGEEGINFKGGAPFIDTTIGTNGSASTAGNSTPKICGNERKGYGKEAPPPECNGTITEGTKKLPLVSPPANIATVNSNCRLARNCANGEVDIIGKENGSSKTGVTFNAETRELTVSSASTTLTMGGENYWLCKLIVKSGTIIMPVGAHVRIFLDTPEHCKLPAGATQFEIGGQGSITSGFIPAQGFYEIPGIYMLGNGTAVLHGTPKGLNELMLYAPLGSVEMLGNAKWNGKIAAHEIQINGSIEFTSSEKLQEPPVTYEPLLQRTRYVECSGTPTTPNSGC
ncbi:MAG: hypothetical protein JSU06_06685 [Actinobacteria bacterium]|nr:hypothetical protein [Actinomycetota bacterium]